MLFNLLINIMITVVLIYACKLLMKIKIKKHYFAFLCSGILLMILFCAYYNVRYMNLIIAFFDILFVVFCYEGSLYFKLNFIILFYLCNVECEMLMIKLLSFVFKENIFNVVHGVYVVYIASSVLMAILVKLFSMMINKKDEKIWFLMLIPAISIFLLFEINNNYLLIHDLRIYLILLFGVILVNVTTLYQYQKSLNIIKMKSKLEAEIKDSNHRNEIIRNELRQNQLFLHNIRVQTKEMKELLKEKKYDKLDEYIQNIYGDTINNYNLIHSNFEVVDALIHDRLYIIKNNHIYFRSILESTSFSEHSLLEIGNMFSFLIDYAISSCLNSNSDNKKIIISSKEYGKQNVLVFSFTSNQRIDESEIQKQFYSIFEKEIDYYAEYNELEKESKISIIFRNIK